MSPSKFTSTGGDHVDTVVQLVEIFKPVLSLDVVDYSPTHSKVVTESKRPKTESSVPQTTFHKFPALPSTIRKGIWRLAFLDTQAPRVVEIRAHVEENLLWEIDCETIIFPEPTGSRVVRWMEVNPRDNCVIERVCQESRAVVKEAWDFCFADRHSDDVEMVEVLRDHDGVAQVRYLDGKVLEEKLGVDFRRGIRFLSDRDTIYLRTRDHETRKALQDARASMLDLSRVKKVAIDIFWKEHYVLEKQLFEGWRGDDEEADLKRRFPTPESRCVREQPILKELKELTLVMDVAPLFREGESPPMMPRPTTMYLGNMFFGTQLVDGEIINDEVFDTKMYSVIERLEKYEMVRSGDLKVELSGEWDLTTLTEGERLEIERWRQMDLCKHRYSSRGGWGKGS
ncbi:hypothetical protein MFRU_022g00010 [Monilinia fructicola]|uniref:2EXR domain-containing protein n=1 Tax=Monilinia fructicola TaxID=38448 RepID=A0A5M9JBS5_MONFR|nr:hypothetical protein EYC84_009849 [Monilinia fructicola]KAG4028280.1 hypothetical protein MFRU_022g00010 [Monilinia fructicola]